MSSITTREPTIRVVAEACEEAAIEAHIEENWSRLADTLPDLGDVLIDYDGFELLRTTITGCCRGRGYKAVLTSINYRAKTVGYSVERDWRYDSHYVPALPAAEVTAPVA